MLGYVFRVVKILYHFDQKVSKSIRECGAARSRCEWLRDLPRGGVISHSLPSATQRVPRRRPRVPGPSMDRISFSCCLSTFLCIQRIASRINPRRKIRFRQNFRYKEKLLLGPQQISRPVSKRVSSCFLKETMFFFYQSVTYYCFFFFSDLKNLLNHVDDLRFQL